MTQLPKHVCKLLIADYLEHELPGAHVDFQDVDGGFSAHVSTTRDFYTIQIGDQIEVIDSDGDAVKTLFETWEDAANTVVEALK